MDIYAGNVQPITGNMDLAWRVTQYLDRLLIHDLDSQWLIHEWASWWLTYKQDSILPGLVKLGNMQDVPNN